MQEVELTDGQEEALSALVDLSRHEETPIPGRNIVETIDQNPGTIRNQIQSLKSLQLVEGIPGPKGGYKPTVEAYRILDRQSFDTPESLTLAYDYTRINVTVTEIDFTSVYHPDQCHVQVMFEGPIDEFSVGDPILIGPTPSSDLVVGGEITTIDHQTNELELDVARLEAPLTT